MAQRQIVLPLVQENVMLGLLVVGREDRGWSPGEQAQIDQIASTLAIACVLDQRYQWLESDRQHDRQIEAQQHDRLDNLLHQFRNSLTALQTFGKLILKRLQPDDRNQEAASSLVRETIRLRELAHQLELAVQRPAPSPLALPGSESETDSQPLDLPLLTGSLADSSLTVTPVPVRAVLEPLLASAETIAQDRHLFLHTLIPEKLPLVWAEAQALREVLNNLIENALKYTPSGGHVLVQVSLSASAANSVGGKLEEKAPTWLELTISDTGPGIPAQDLPHIFEAAVSGSSVPDKHSWNGARTGDRKVSGGADARDDRGSKSSSDLGNFRGRHGDGDELNIAVADRCRRYTRVQASGNLRKNIKNCYAPS